MKRIVMAMMMAVVAMCASAQKEYRAYSYISGDFFVLSSDKATLVFDCTTSKAGDTEVLYREIDGNLYKAKRINLPFIAYSMQVDSYVYPIGGLINYLAKHGWEIKAGVPTVNPSQEGILFHKTVISDNEIFEGFEQVIEDVKKSAK